MSKAPNSSSNSRRTLARHGKPGTSLARRELRVSCTSTQDLIARIWETLDWPKTLQAALLITFAGLTAGLLLTTLEVAAHAAGSQAAALPVSITITATVSYTVARRRRH